MVFRRKRGPAPCGIVLAVSNRFSTEPVPFSYSRRVMRGPGSPNPKSVRRNFFGCSKTMSLQRKTLIGVVFVSSLAVVGYLLAPKGSGPSDLPPSDAAANTEATPPAENPINDAIGNTSLPTAPGLANPSLIAPLADAYRRMDPTEDGWQSEAFSEAATAQLGKLGHLLEDAKDDAEATAALATDQFSTGGLRPNQLQTVFDDGVLTVSRSAEANGGRSGQSDPSSLADAIRELTIPFREASNVHAKLKLVQVEPQTDSVSTRVYLLASGETAEGTLQINSTWKCDWSVYDSQPPRLTSIRTESYEESVYRSATQDKKMFSDCTASVLGKNESYHQQFLRRPTHWRLGWPAIWDWTSSPIMASPLATSMVIGWRIFTSANRADFRTVVLQNADGTLRDVWASRAGPIGSITAPVR